MSKEKEQFEPRTYILQDQRFLKLELKSNNKLIYEKLLLPSHKKNNQPQYVVYIPVAIRPRAGCQLKGHCHDKEHVHFLLTNRNRNVITSATHSPGVSSAFRKYLYASFRVFVCKEYLSCLCCVKALSVLLSPNLHPHLQLCKVSDLRPSIFYSKLTR